MLPCFRNKYVLRFTATPTALHDTTTTTNNGGGRNAKTRTVFSTFFSFVAKVTRPLPRHILFPPRSDPHTPEVLTMAENVLTPHFKILNLGNLEERVGDKVCIVSAHTSRCISMNPDGTVTTSGNPEQRAEWRVLRDGDGPNTLGPVVGFKNVETGLFLAIKGKTVIGDECNSEHCKFIAQTDQTEVFLKKSSNPFFSLGVNADDQPVRLQWEPGDERSRFYIIDCYQFKKLRAHNEEQAVKLQPEAKFVLTSKTKPAALRSHSDLESKTVYIVSEETSQPIMMMRDGSVNANGGLTTASLFRVQRLGPAFGFQSVACCDFLAIKDGLLTHGNGDGDCRFSVEVAQTATWLKKHNNTSMRVGFNADGRPVNANNVGDGQARVWIFDAARVHFQAVPSRQPQTEKEEQGDDSPQASSSTDPQPPQIQQQQGQEDMRPQRNDHAHSEQPLVPPANSATYRQQYPISQANIQAHAQHPNQPYIPQSHNYCSYPSQPPAHGHGIPQAHAYMPHSSQTQLRAGHPHPQHLAPAHYVGHVLPGQPCVVHLCWHTCMLNVPFLGAQRMLFCL